jgi:Family of unknown function (DUF5706)
MANAKPEFLDSLFEQIESQVQFGDSKASLLVAGDAILLAVSGGLIKMVSGCQGDDFTVSCMVPSASLGLATFAAVLLSFSLVCSLLAARPARIHDQPLPELFLVSHIARIDVETFAKQYTAASSDDLVQEALKAIHGKARYADKKFRLLKHAVDSTLMSIVFTIATVVLAVGLRFVG